MRRHPRLQDRRQKHYPRLVGAFGGESTSIGANPHRFEVVRTVSCRSTLAGVAVIQGFSTPSAAYSDASSRWVTGNGSAIA